MRPGQRFAASFAALAFAASMAACGEGESGSEIEIEETAAAGGDAAEQTLGDTAAEELDEAGELDPGAPEPALAPAAEPTNQTVIGEDCKLFEARNIDFTPAEQEDLLSVRIDQTDCQNAILDIEIADSEGEVIYEHDVAFSAFDRTDAEQTGVSIAEAYQAKAIDVLNTPVQPASELTPYEEEFMAGSPNLKLTQVEYEALRNSGLNYFCHWDGYENSVCIVYDEETGRAKTFLTRTPGAGEKDEAGGTAQ